MHLNDNYVSKRNIAVKGQLNTFTNMCSVDHV